MVVLLHLLFSVAVGVTETPVTPALVLLAYTAVAVSALVVMLTQYLIDRRTAGC